MNIALENGGAFDSETRPLWLTRDDLGDGPGDVEVWVSRPELIAGVWLPADVTLPCAPAAEVETDAARIIFGTVPETGRECVRLD